MISDYVIRKTSKLAGKIIIPPTPEEILADNFNYPDYVQNILEYQIDEEMGQLIDQFLKYKPEDYQKVDPDIEILFDNFEKAIIEIQRQYEIDRQNGNITIDYNKEMKKIAQTYFNHLMALNKFKLDQEREFQALTAKRNELLNALNQVLEIKEKIETQAETRLNAFVNREIPITKLYIYDLIKPTNSEVYKKHRKALEKYKRQIFSRLLNDEGIEYKPIGELNFRKKKS